MFFSIFYLNNHQLKKLKYKLFNELFISNKLVIYFLETINQQYITSISNKLIYLSNNFNK